jgi:septum formation protein
VRASPPLILASSSPRRLALLRQAGVEPWRVEAPAVDEAPLPREQPKAYALRLASAKAASVAARAETKSAFILGADTVVACGRRILPKPTEPDEAARCLELLSGRRHRVLTGIAVIAPDGRRATKAIMTVVQLKRLSGEEIASYLAGGEWRGKAGGYAIQGGAEAFVRAINGSWSNVVGLPLAATLDLLHGLGWRPAA